jgi:hypothetical protein
MAVSVGGLRTPRKTCAQTTKTSYFNRIDSETAV